MSDLDLNETRARQGFMAMNLARLGGLALLLGGIAATQGALDVAFEFGVLMAVAGFFGFFFLPRLIAKRVKAEQAQDQQ